MKRVVISLVVVLLCFVSPIEVHATSGFLKSSSIKTCNGVMYGKHGDGHWHVAVKTTDGKYSASGDPIHNDPCGNNSNSSSSPVISPKSSDNTIKSVQVNGQNVSVTDSMEYKTDKEKVTIAVTLNNVNASLDYDRNIDLEIGDNLIKLSVKAEDGSIKDYSLNIIREKKLSSNKNIKIYVDNEELSFILFKNDTLKVSSNTDKLNITYELEDSNATVEIKGNENLKVGENKVIVTVKAENGDTQDYIITVEKYSKGFDVISGIATVAVFGGIIYGIYYFVKKRKK